MATTDKWKSKRRENMLQHQQKRKRIQPDNEADKVKGIKRGKIEQQTNEEHVTRYPGAATVNLRQGVVALVSERAIQLTAVKLLLVPEPLQPLLQPPPPLVLQRWSLGQSPR